MKILTVRPRRMIDIGCGPGNSTNVLKVRWPQAEIIGLDSSNAMIAEARAKYPMIEWLCADASGDLTQLGKFDLVFSNAAIQWMPRHEQLLRKLFNMLNAGGMLAIQVPNTERMPVYIELGKLAASDKWKGRFAEVAGVHSMHDASFYYDIICGLSDEVDLWETRYFHVMNTHADIVKWYSSTGLKPYLDCLKDDAPRAEFQMDFENALRGAYPVQADGRVLFPFTRIFFTLKRDDAAKSRLPLHFKTLTSD
ncbi:MAG: methyltransferase domain-containing protein [Betaproteobacteria bacterium]|nr:methyltransferase domain-containing protein [Betaproteobacteria bacterium]